MSDANKISQKQAIACLQKLRVGYGSGDDKVEASQASGPCVLHLKALGERYPKMKVSLEPEGLPPTKKKRPSEYSIHHLVIRSKGELIIKGLEVSHLCHQSRCIEASHLIQESGALNRDRQPCAKAQLITITCDCGRTHTVNPCQHEPACILT